MACQQLKIDVRTISPLMTWHIMTWHA